MNERARRSADQLAADRDVIGRAAGIIRSAPGLTGRDRLAGLHDPATVGRLADLLDVLADRIDILDPLTRDYVVRIARDTAGDRMDSPGVRRTHRR